jgi:hypothetical protein
MGAVPKYLYLGVERAVVLAQFGMDALGAVVGQNIFSAR